MVYKFRISRPRQSQPACRVGRRAYYILNLAVSCVDSKTAANMLKLLSIVYLHGVVACRLAAAAWCASFFVSYCHIYLPREAPSKHLLLKSNKTKQTGAPRSLPPSACFFCNLTHRYYTAENVLGRCDIDILHALYYIYGTLLYMKPPCKDIHSLMETLPLVQFTVASTSI